MSIANQALRRVDTQNNIDFVDNVIFDYRLAEVAKKTKIPTRQYVILGLLIFSITVFFIGKTQDTRPQEIVESAPVSLDSILIDSIFTDFMKSISDSGSDNLSVNLSVNQSADRSSNDSAVPDHVLNFIQYNEVAVEVTDDKIILFEIVDTQKDQALIDQLLVEADTFLNRDRLTSPRNNNAFERYQAVLALDAKNQIALDGIRNIVGRYVYLSEYVIRKKEEFKVADLIKKAYRVGGNYMDMQPILDKYSRYIEGETVFINLPKEPTSAGIVSASSDAPKVGAFNMDQAIAKVDQETAVTAMRLVNIDDVSTAIKLLENFVGLTNSWGKSNDLLLSLYVKSGSLSKAENLVYLSDDLNVYNLAEKASRIFIARGDMQGALDLLETHEPVLQDYKNYYGLKAGLYFSLGEHDKAVDLYRSLIRYDHDNSRHWLGLAVSMDSLGNDMAVEAFRYARDYASVNSPVKTYLEQNILAVL